MLDPHYDKVVALFPLNGENGSPILADYSMYGANGITQDTAHQTDAQFKNYPTSLLTGGAVDGHAIIRPAPTTDGTEDFTIEFWWRPKAREYNIGMIGMIYGYSDAWGYYGVEYRDNGSPGETEFDCFWAFYVWNVATNDYVSGESAPITPLIMDKWYHFALVREGDYAKLYVGGVMVCSVAGATGAKAPDWYQFYDDGYYQDFRLTYGVARYTADFTPPGALLSSISGTILDSDGNPAERTVAAIPRGGTVGSAWSTRSDPVDGFFSLLVPGTEVSRVVLADEAVVMNDLVDRIAIPE